MKDKKTKLIFLSIILIILIVLLVFIIIRENKVKSNDDAKRFKEEYSSVSDDNVFVYRNIDEIIKILENGTGIVYLGFPECPWCQAYVKILNEVTQEEGLEKIYYFNIREDRNNNTDKYQKIVALLGDNLFYDEEGNRRIMVPDVTAVLKGKIIGHDNETSNISGNPDEYWTEEKVNNLKSKLREMIIKVNEELCTSCK